MKTKAENIRLFEEARTLRKSVRSDLHSKATNAPEKQFNTYEVIGLNMHNKCIQLTAESVTSFAKRRKRDAPSGGN
jgi:hypothetical protein